MGSALIKRRRASPKAVQRARDLSEELCLDHICDIDAEMIAHQRGAVVQYKLLPGELGRLVRQTHGKGSVIVVRQDLCPERQRFVIMHEVGHLELHPTLNQFKSCSEGDMVTYRGDGCEAEANHFAAEVLMPKSLFAPLCDVREPSLRAVDHLAKTFGVSKMSAGIRFTKYCPEPCAFIFSRDKTVMWSAKSASFPFYISDRELLCARNDSFAGEFHAGKGAPPDGPGIVDADAWSDSDEAEHHMLFEHSYGWREDSSTCVMSLLWLRSDL